MEATSSSGFLINLLLCNQFLVARPAQLDQITKKRFNALTCALLRE